MTIIFSTASISYFIFINNNSNTNNTTVINTTIENKTINYTNNEKPVYNEKTNYHEDDYLSSEELKVKYPKMTDIELFEKYGER